MVFEILTLVNTIMILWILYKVPERHYELEKTTQQIIEKMVSKDYLNCRNVNHKLVISYRDRDFSKNRIVKSCYCGKVKKYEKLSNN